VTLVTLGQVAAYAAAQSATQACTDGRTGLAAQAVADHRTTGSTHATADGSAGTVAFFSRNRTACCACNTSTNGCTSAAAHALAYDVTQRTAQTATDGGSAVTSHCTLSNQKTQNQSRQCETHDKNLKNRGVNERGEIECFRGENVQTCARSTSLLATVGQHFSERFYDRQKKARWGTGRVLLLTDELSLRRSL
jgi:hypothetical protein